MARYTPEFLASVRHDVEETDMPLSAIAKKHEIGLRTLHRWIEREQWRKRSERLHDLPPAARLLSEATALLTERGKADASDIDAGRAKRSVPATPPPDAQAADAVDVGTARSAPLPILPTAPSAIDRLERLVEKELDAEEAVRAQLGPLPRNAADAERTARTLSTLTRTLHALQRLRSGLGFQSHDDDDDMPRDIDEFRRDLARRIDAFVASRTQRNDGDGNPSARQVEPI